MAELELLFPLSFFELSRRERVHYPQERRPDVRLPHAFGSSTTETAGALLHLYEGRDAAYGSHGSRTVVCWVDSDWADDVEMRRSVGGGLLTLHRSKNITKHNSGFGRHR